MNLTNTMILWDDETGDVLLKAWPEQDNLHRGYKSHGACWSYIRQMDFESRKTILFIEFAHLVVRDGIDPQKLHLVLLGLDEYRDGCAVDMPVAAAARKSRGEHVGSYLDR